MYLDELSESTGVVVAHRLGVAECFQQRIRCNMEYALIISKNSMSAIVNN